MSRRRKHEWMKDMSKITGEVIKIGIDGYFLSSTFILVTVGIMKILVKIGKKNVPMYDDIFIFSIIGVFVSVFLKIFKLDILYKAHGFLIVFIINVIIFIIFKLINGPRKEKTYGNIYKK